jgi:hypothetical protein
LQTTEEGYNNSIKADKRQRNGYSNSIKAVKRQRNLDGYSNSIKAVKRQRNLGLQSMLFLHLTFYAKPTNRPLALEGWFEKPTNKLFGHVRVKAYICVYIP